jgi:hypothetical protein
MYLRNQKISVVNKSRLFNSATAVLMIFECLKWDGNIKSQDFE